MISKDNKRSINFCKQFFCYVRDCLFLKNLIFYLHKEQLFLRPSTFRIKIHIWNHLIRFYCKKMSRTLTGFPLQAVGSMTTIPFPKRPTKKKDYLAEILVISIVGSRHFSLLEYLIPVYRRSKIFTIFVFFQIFQLPHTRYIG